MTSVPRADGSYPPYIKRNIPTYDILSEENLLKVEATADRILAEIGIEFRDDPRHWISGERLGRRSAAIW